MTLYSAAVLLDGEDRVGDIHWNDPFLEQAYGGIWAGFRGRTAAGAFGLPPDEEGVLHWREERFTYALVPVGSGGRCLLLARLDDRMHLYESVLERIIEGIQIYDKNAQVVYINKASRVISDIPDMVKIRGRHLLDLYQLDEDISTVMTALRTGAPVINRFDVFQSTKGTDITSTNSAYPVFHGEELAGAVVFEQDMNVIKAQIAQLEKIRAVMAEKAEHLPHSRFSGYTFDDVVGRDKKITDAVDFARRIAARDCHVLLVGETGTGKEIFAQSIHRASGRRDKKFLAINCAAVPEPLIEGLFFGTSKGSFTGSADRTGYAEEADGGTLFLDELNSMSLSMQAKILRVIQEGVFRRVGGDKEIRTDLRIISSCNESPFRLIAENTLRKDLFYRLSTVLIDLPPLRERPGDIEELVASYIAGKSYHFVKAIEGVSPAAMDILRRYPWPGNVRELFHVLDHALNVVDGSRVEPEHLPKYIQEATPAQESAGSGAPAEDFLHQELQQIMDRHEERVLRQVLEHHGYNITKAADALGLRRQSLQYRIKKYGIVI